MKKLVIGLMVVVLALGVLPSLTFTQVSAAKPPGDTYLGSIDYGVDTELTPTVAPWDWQMIGASYSVRVKEDFSTGQTLEFEVDDSVIRLQPMALEWTNDYGQIQHVSMPWNVTPTITNPDSEGTITWDNTYGSGIDFEWKCTPLRLDKVLTISGLNDLPVPSQYIRDGGNPVLRLSLIFAPSSDVDIYVNGSLWDKSLKQKTFDQIEFHKDGEVLWNFMPLMYWDSEGNEEQSVAIVEKRGDSLYISISVPYEWLQDAVYPVFLDADITIEVAASTTMFNRAIRSSPFWTSPTVGYAIYLDANTDLVYQKTVNGGANWGGAVNIRTGTIHSYDCWADWQTEGDAGTKIHIAYIDQGSDDIRYVYLDTDDDSVGGDDLIEACQGTGSIHALQPARSTFLISIAKARGGNLAVAFRYKDTNNVFFYSFYTSPDGDTWTSKNTPWEAVADYVQLYAGNEADNQDLWATFWDTSVDEISLKTYDNSGNSWGEQLISANMTDRSDWITMDGAIRLSDGHLIFAAWSKHDDVTSDLKTWDINGAGSITAKTNVITDTKEYALVSVFVNQINDDIYVAYLGGTDFGAEVAALYKKSDDGGGTWGGETAMQADAEDDEKWISAGAMSPTGGGKFQPIWFNSDLNDLFTNTDNGISIVAIAPPTVTTQAATNVEDTTATGNGNITDTGGENCDRRGIVWDLASHGDPGNVAPGASGYANDVGTNGDFGTGAFTESLTGLPTGDVIYCRAYAHNSGGYDYGAEVNFLTKPAAPTNVAATDGTHPDKVVVTWTKSTGATGYKVYEGANLLDTLGDVATYDDTNAPAGTIDNAGTVTASDGTETAHVVLSLAGESVANGASRTYKVVAFNATGDSDDSATNDGYRTPSAITYQWQRSAGDADGGYGNIGGATTDPYNDVGAPAGTISNAGTATASDGTSTVHVTLSLAGEATTDGAGRYYQCIVSAVGASNSPQTSDNNRGYRGVGAITYQWQRSAADSDADYGNIGGATTDPYNDTGAPANGDGRWYLCVVSSVDASNSPQNSTHDRGYRAVAPTATTVNCSGFDTDWAILNATVDTLGLPATVTEVGFDYGLTEAYGNSSTKTGTWAANDEFWVKLTGLDPGVVYHARAKAFNGVWGYGSDMVFSTEGSPTLYEYLNTNGDAEGDDIYAGNWSYMQFTVGTVAHSLDFSIIYVKRTGAAPGDATLSLKHADGANKPTGADIDVKVLDADNFSAALDWVKFDFPDDVTLEAGESYALVLRCPNGDAANYLEWRWDAGGSLADAIGGKSTDSGVSWTVDAGGADYLFENWGEPVFEVLAANVFTGYLETGDWLVVTTYKNYYTPYYPAESCPANFYMRLLDDTTMIAQTNCPSYGYYPTCFYFSKILADGMEWGDSDYKVRMYGDFGANPYTDYNIAASDWKGADLQFLDSWVLEQANIIGDDTDTSLTVNIADRGEVLNVAGHTMFSNGIPYINEQRPELFEMVAIQPEFEEEDFDTDLQDEAVWTTRTGTDVTDVLTKGGGLFDIEGYEFGGIMVFVIFCIIVAILAMTGHVLTGLAIGYPILLAGAWFGLIGWVIVGVLTFIVAAIFIWRVWLIR